MDLQEALRSLKHDDPAHWTQEGLPNLNVLKELTGKRVGRAECEAALPGYVRQPGASTDGILPDLNGSQNEENGDGQGSAEKGTDEEPEEPGSMDDGSSGDDGFVDGQTTAGTVDAAAPADGDAPQGTEREPLPGADVDAGEPGAEPSPDPDVKPEQEGVGDGGRDPVEEELAKKFEAEQYGKSPAQQLIDNQAMLDALRPTVAPAMPVLVNAMELMAKAYQVDPLILAMHLMRDTAARRQRHTIPTNVQEALRYIDKELKR